MIDSFRQYQTKEVGGWDGQHERGKEMIPQGSN